MDMLTCYLMFLLKLTKNSEQIAVFFGTWQFEALGSRNYQVVNAEREGFEPSRDFTPCHVSSVVVSASHPPLQF